LKLLPSFTHHHVFQTGTTCYSMYNKKRGKPDTIYSLIFFCVPHQKESHVWSGRIAFKLFHYIIPLSMIFIGCLWGSSFPFLDRSFFRISLPCAICDYKSILRFLIAHGRISVVIHSVLTLSVSS